MEEIIDYLRETIKDEVLSKPERRTLNSMLENKSLGDEELNFLRSKIYELAQEHMRDNNYKFILDWVKMSTNTLMNPVRAELAEAYFSPGEACRNAIIQQLEGALQHIHICVFTISDDAISRAILAAHRKGRSVRIITDNDKSFDEGSDIEQLAQEGISVKMDVTTNHMHHKFMVVDYKTLLTGSYNWTRSAARFNHENILLTQESGVVKLFQNQFEQLWKEMVMYK